MKDEELRKQINELIRDEIQDVINDYVDEKEHFHFLMINLYTGFLGLWHYLCCFLFCCLVLKL